MLVLRRKWHRFFEFAFNLIGTYVPSQFVRLTILRFAGAKIGNDATIRRGTIILDQQRFRIGSNCIVGGGCMIDARGSVTIGDRVTIAEGTHIITASHDPNSSNFSAYHHPVVIEDGVRVENRSTILCGVTLGHDAIVGLGSLVNSNVQPLQTVSGIPAKPVGICGPAPEPRTTRCREETTHA